MDRRVFIFWKNPLFFESVRLLLNHPDIEIVGQSELIGGIQPAVSHLKPDTIIVEELDTGVPPEVLALLEKSSHPSRIIGFSMNDNRLNVFHREERTVGLASDLVQIISNDY